MKRGKSFLFQTKIVNNLKKVLFCFFFSLILDRNKTVSGESCDKSEIP